jgi:hypothetical protein
MKKEKEVWTNSMEVWKTEDGSGNKQCYLPPGSAVPVPVRGVGVLLCAVRRCRISIRT